MPARKDLQKQKYYKITILILIFYFKKLLFGFFSYTLF